MIKNVKIFFDADALIAGSASQTGASFLLLQLCELGFLQGITSKQVIAECRKNLQLKLPAAVPVFEEIVQRTLSVCSNPGHENIKKYSNMAHEKDLPILVAAILQAANHPQN
jgi:predicted nucleic acid-binding protein